jgi:pimeloyl-ACP methyl ester carboxylesterase
MWDMFVHRWLRVPYTLYVTTDRKVKRPKATVVFIHGIGHSGSVWKEAIAQLPNDVRIISVDLLGFGQSPKPHWAIYDVRLQAKMFIATVLRLRINGPMIMVGHSLGALVSVEIARRYPLLVKSLILCSPPFYRPDPSAKRLLPHSDQILKDIYKAIHKRPDQFVKISKLAVKYGLVNKSFNVTSDDVHSYMGALEASIINQRSFSDAMRLKKPMHIIHGALDPVVIAKNLKLLAKHNSSVKLNMIIAGHELRGPYIPAIVKAVGLSTGTKTKHDRTTKKRQRQTTDV